MPFDFFIRKSGKASPTSLIISRLENFPDEVGQTVAQEIREATPTHRRTVRYYRTKKEIRAHIAVVTQDRGRGRNKPAPPVYAIALWMQKYRIRGSPYAIARSIGEHGYPGKHFIKPAIVRASQKLESRSVT